MLHSTGKVLLHVSEGLFGRIKQRVRGSCTPRKVGLIRQHAMCRQQHLLPDSAELEVSYYDHAPDAAVGLLHYY